MSLEQDRGLLGLPALRPAIREKVEWHHLVPKSKGGRATVPLNPIGYRKINTLFSDTELT